MGGNLFKLPRMPRTVYLEVEATVRAALEDLIPGRFRIPKYHADKLDFGDLDVLVASGALAGEPGAAFRERFAEVTDASEVRHAGNVWSFAIAGLQVDLFATDEALLDTRAQFMSWGDCGNLLGRMLKPLGLKWGEDGLVYVLRREGDEHFKKTFLLSTSIDDALRAAGLDAAGWHAGFASEEAMFRYLVSATRFEARPYVRAEGTFRQRLETRPGMGRFLAFLQREGHVAGEKPAREDPAVVAALFPGIDLLGLLAEANRRADVDTTIKRKLDGRRIMELRPDLRGAALGEYLRALRASPGFEAWATTASQAEIDARIVADGPGAGLSG